MTADSPVVTTETKWHPRRMPWVSFSLEKGSHTTSLNIEPTAYARINSATSFFLRRSNDTHDTRR